MTLDRNRRSVCNDPASSILFDGHVPTLTGLDGDTWASQLMIIHRPQYGQYSFTINFDFSSTPGSTEIGKVEVTLFNCLQWGIGVNYFRIYTRTYTYVYPTVSSCDSLMKFCVEVDTARYGHIRQIYFHRYINNYIHRVYVAEIAFYNYSTSPCPFMTIIPGAPPSGKLEFYHPQIN